MSILIKKGEATELEKQVSQAMTELQTSSKDSLIASLKLTGAKEITTDGQKVIIVEVPYKMISSYKKIMVAIVPELEKKLGNSQVIIVAKRRALPKTPEPGRRYKVIRGNGRTLRKVQEDLLDDVVFPTAIVSKRIQYGTNGKQTTYVTLDANDKTRVEDRLKAFSAAYGKLTGKKAIFEVATH